MNHLPFHWIIRLSFGICMNISHMKSMNRKWEALKLFLKERLSFESCKWFFYATWVLTIVRKVVQAQLWAISNAKYLYRFEDKREINIWRKLKKLAFQIYDLYVSRDLRYPLNVSCILKGIQSYVCSKDAKKNIQNFL